MRRWVRHICVPQARRRAEGIELASQHRSSLIPQPSLTSIVTAVGHEIISRQSSTVESSSVSPTITRSRRPRVTATLLSLIPLRKPGYSVRTHEMSETSNSSFCRAVTVPHLGVRSADLRKNSPDLDKFREVETVSSILQSRDLSSVGGKYRNAETLPYGNGILLARADDDLQDIEHGFDLDLVLV